MLVFFFFEHTDRMLGKLSIPATCPLFVRLSRSLPQSTLPPTLPPNLRQRISSPRPVRMIGNLVAGSDDMGYMHPAGGPWSCEEQTWTHTATAAAAAMVGPKSRRLGGLILFNSQMIFLLARSYLS